MIISTMRIISDKYDIQHNDNETNKLIMVNNIDNNDN